MQFGHLGIALAIASIDPRPETFAVVTAAQFLPNADSLLIRAGWARPPRRRRAGGAGRLGAPAL